MNFETAPSIVSLTTATDVRFSSFGISVGLVSFSYNRWDTVKSMTVRTTLLQSLATKSRIYVFLVSSLNSRNL